MLWGFYMLTVITLKDPAITFQSAVASIRASQATFRELHPAPMIALVNEKRENNSRSNASLKKKTCTHCGRLGHLREECFIWLDTPDGSKWASKNPEKARKVRMMKEKSRRRKGKKKDNPTKSNEDLEESHKGAWMIEEHALFSNGPTKDSDIILDTGVTNHIFHNHSLIYSLSPISKSARTASGLAIPVSGIGCVRFNVRNFDGERASKITEM